MIRCSAISCPDSADRSDALGLLAALGLASTLLYPTPASAEAPAATPYRPSVANPAELPAPGWLEVEAGAVRTQGGDAAREDSLPYTLKYAFSPDFGVLLGGDARVRQIDVDGSRSSGRGDTTLIFKHRLHAGQDAAWGLEWGAKFDTAARDLGSGKNDYLLTGIYSVDVADLRIDTNLGATWLGLREPGLGRWQYGWAVSLSSEVIPGWTLAAELSGELRRGAPDNTQFLAAASHSLSRRLVVDFGAAAGLNREAADWSFFAGLTWLATGLQ